MNSEASLSIYAYQFSADPQIIPDVRSKFIEFLLSLGLNDTEKEGWKLTFTEAVNNAIEHGSYGLPEKIISARWWAQGNSIWLETQDEGPGPSKEQQATPRLPADPLAEGGRGLFIIHNFSDTHEHWISASGYTAQMGKHYERLNNVTAQNEEMDAIMDELSDCYESLSLYDRMAENLLEDQLIDHSIRSGLEIFMDSRDYDAINIEMHQSMNIEALEWIDKVEAHAFFGHLLEGNWQLLKQSGALIWNTKSPHKPFDRIDEYPTGACVPILVSDRVVGLIAVAYANETREIRSNDVHHLKALADIFAATLSRRLMEKERDERQRLSTEINIATKLQRQLLPISHEPANIPGYDLLIHSISALEVAGDFVEVSLNSEGEYTACVIDVMGKGISAAILAGIFRSQFIAFNHRGGSLSNFLKYTNMALEAQLGEATMFITAFVFKLNPTTHELSYAGAGHPPALLFTADGKTTQLVSSGPPIGLFREMQYTENRIQLAPQDRLLIVTDGLYEWTQADGNRYNWDDMVHWFETHRDIAPAELWDLFHNKMDAARHTQNILQEDDETVLILSRNTL